MSREARPGTAFLAPILLAVVVLTAGCADAAGDRRAAATALRFESEPRPVLGTVGVAASKDPAVAVNAAETLYLLAVHGPAGAASLGLSTSHDGGDSFAPLLPVSPPGARVSSHGENSPRLAVTPTEIYALWERGADDGFTTLQASRSIDFGRSFEPPVEVTAKPEPSFNGFADLGVAPDGTVWAAWLDGRDTGGAGGTFSLYVSRSVDRGASFGADHRVGPGACPCCRPALAFGGGATHVAWRTVGEGNVRDVYLVSSRGSSPSFGPRVPVARDNWEVQGCPHSGPALVADGERLWVAWYSEGDHGAGVHVARSTDGGRTFEPSVRVSGPVLDANHPELSLAGDGRVMLVFQGRDPQRADGWSDLQPSAVPVLAGPAAYPALAAGTLGRTFVAWTEPGPAGRRVVLSRGRVR